jgi:hypothetical protein
MAEQPVNRPDPSPSQPHPLRTTAIVIYGTFALLAVTIPQSVVNWLGDMRGNPVQETLMRAAEALQSAADGTGIAAPFRRARDLFDAVTGHDNN